MTCTSPVRLREKRSIFAFLEFKDLDDIVVQIIVTKFLGRPGRGTGSRVEGRHFIKLWYEGGISLWNDKLLCGTRL